MEQADIIVYLFDVNDTPASVAVTREELVARGKSFLLVGNKIDGLPDEAAVRSRFPQELLISARLSRHVDVLKQRLVDQVLAGNTASAAGEGTIVTNARHFHALQQVSVALEAIRRGLDELLPGDLLSLDIRVCLHWLGEITGEVTSEERLDYIFSKFCIGK